MKKIASYSLKSLLLICLISFLSFPLKLMAQEADTSATLNPVLEIILQNTKPGARSTGLANTSVADYTELSSVYINPAVLSFVSTMKRVEINSSQNWDNHFMLQNVTVPLLAYKRHRATLQTGLLHKGFGEGTASVNSIDFTPNLTLYRFNLAYSFSITQSLSIGVLNSTSFAQNTRSDKSGNLLSFGMLYAPSKSISYGVAFRELGRNIRYMASDSVKTRLITQSSNESLELGATLHYPVDTDKTYFSLSIANEKRFGEPGLWYKTGLEVNLKILPEQPKLHIRNGLIMQPESEIYAPTFGLGMDFKKYSISYSVSPGTQLQNRFHQLGVILHFDNF